ncbi:MAG: ethanolamine ammonia-lyase reactivating factor EutA [Lachnospirales bacterium]
MKDIIKSVGIDIGTTTTQIIFSSLVISNRAGYGIIPKVEIISKEIIYKSPVYFTPLLNENEIDGLAVKKIIEKEYENANIKPEELSTGAVIITGESSRKDNAESVVNAISSLAGDFVVAIAGPKQESVLAGKGAGADDYSAEIRGLVANLDIGGGTTNISLFNNGKLVDATCLDIGGRLIKCHNGTITYISEKIKKLIDALGLNLSVGDELTSENATFITNAMSFILAFALGDENSAEEAPKELLNNRDYWLDYFLVNDRLKYKADVITFSGGVADCIWNNYDNFSFGDIGVFLGKSINNNGYLKAHFGKRTKETLRATVVGAGNFSMDITGCTIEYTNCKLPVKNVPVYFIDWDNEDYNSLEVKLNKKLDIIKEELIESKPIALSMKGPKCPTFYEIETMAEILYKGLLNFADEGRLIVIILENDIGKALGQALKRRFIKGTALICIDGISTNEGSYIDIGEPLSGGSVLPVVIKTLVFNM